MPKHARTHTHTHISLPLSLSLALFVFGSWVQGAMCGWFAVGRSGQNGKAISSEDIRSFNMFAMR